MAQFNWDQIKALPPRSFTCGYCGNLVSSASGFSGGGVTRVLYICPHCQQPTYWWGDKRVPDVAPGQEVASLPDGVAALYREARVASAAGAYTSSVLASRKLLMSIGVSLGASEGLPFIAYVDFLADKGYVPPNGRGWVDHIRKRGNEATHEIRVMSPQDAAELITFLEMLLKFIYEFPSRVPAATLTPSP
jgi:hypothetical protein